MDTILYPIKWVISWIMFAIHEGLTAVGLPDGAGSAWVWSIVGLTIVIRILIIPLYNKQIKATRIGQEMQPELQKLQKKYRGKTDAISKQRQQEEMMALYRDRGTSPFASCFPLLIQMPIFLALFRLLYAVKDIAAGSRGAIGAIDQEIAEQISESTVFGAPLASSLGTAGEFANPNAVRIVAIALIALMCLTLFYSQRQLMTKNLPESSQDPNNPAYKMQKYMLYGMPLLYIFTGYAFQVGVLVYWLTGNVWNIGQQTWLIKTNPTPGSAAYKARQERLRAKGKLPEDETVGKEESTGQRVQPLGKERSKKAAAKGAPIVPNEPVVHEANDSELRGLDGLTDAERAQKRYERRMAERQRANQKKKARTQKQQQNMKKRNF